MTHRLLVLVAPFIVCCLRSSPSQAGSLQANGNDSRLAQTTETEPNNTADLANVMEYGDSLDASISPAGDVDYYKFTAAEGDTVEVYAHDTGGSTLDGMIWLYSSTGSTLTNNNYYNGSSYQQRVVYIIPGAGTYYIRYASSDNWGSFPNQPVKKPGQGVFGKPENRLGLSYGNKLGTLPGGHITAPNGLLSNNGDYRIVLRKFTSSSPVVWWANPYDIYWNSARFSGSLYPNGLPTTVTFEYGTTTSYGGSAPAVQSPVNGIDQVDVNTSQVTGLSANTLYHSRMKATNSQGTTFSNDYLFTTPQAPEGWVAQNSGTTSWLNAVSFTDANTGTVVGEGGTILRTTDGGANWTSKNTGIPYLFLGISFTDANTGTVVGAGTILRTTDGGASWVTENSGSDWLFGVSFTDANTGTIVGDAGTILRTTDGGASWTAQTSGVGNTLRGVFFTDTNTGTAVGDAGTILRTTDGGASWVPQNSGSTYPLFGISFSDANTGTAVGEVGTILRTTDGGASWVPQNSGVGTGLNGVILTDANTGIVVGGNGTILRTTNGGANWIPQSSGTTNYLCAIALTGANNWTAVGGNGVILGSTGYLRVLSPNGGENWKIGNSRNIQWVGGGSTNVKIDLTTDDGVNWTPITASTPAGSGTYGWTVSNTPSTQCRVRLTDAGNALVVDESDGKFTMSTTGAVAETEPNNTADLANVMEYGDSLDASISPAGDVDYYKFTAGEGDTVEVYAYDTDGSTLDGRIWVYNSSGSTLADNSYYNGSSYQQRVVYIIPTAGTFYIKYASNDNWGPFPNQPVKKPGQGVFGRPENTQEMPYGAQSYSNRLGTLPGGHITAPNGLLSNNGDYRIALRRFVSSSPVVLWANPYDVYWNAARFAGSLYPNGLPTTVTFEYGTTTSYGSSAPAVQNPVNGVDQAYVNTSQVIGLSANTPYHSRMKATNSQGTVYTNDYEFTTPQAPEGWVTQNSGTGNDLRGVFFTDINTGTIVGTNGVILRTTNGGGTWEPQSSGSTNWLFSVFFADANTGTVVGDGSVIFRTTDGGAGWTSQTSGVGNTLRGVFFTDANTGTIVGANGVILRTTNGGATWVTQSSGTTDWLYAVFFTDANTGTIVGGNGVILRTTNGGASWVPQNSDSAASLRGVSFTDANTGTAVGDGGTILRTTDGGASWVPQNSGVGTGLNGVILTDANTGIVVGGSGTILRTTNGGASWVQQSSGTTNWLYAIALTGTKTWTAVGEFGVILRSTAYLRVLSPNGRENWKIGNSRNIQWVGGGSTNVKIDLTTDDGVNWAPITASTPAGSGTYAWTVSNTPSTQCRVRLTDAGNALVVDESDGKFTISTTGTVAETEPNNTADLANVIEYGDSLDASINPAGDVDYYKFTATEGDTVEVYAHDTGSSTLDGRIWLYNSSGSFLADNSYYNGSSYQQRVAYIIPGAGMYYIRYASGDNWGPFPNQPVKKPGQRVFGKPEKTQEMLHGVQVYGNKLGTLPGGHTTAPNGLLSNNGDYRIVLRRFVSSSPVVLWANPYDVYWNSARFSGSLYPNGLPTTVTFEYGTTTSYGSSAPAVQSPVNGVDQVYVNTSQVIGLSANTPNHSRMKATNSQGTTYSNDVVFTTPQPPEGWVAQNSGTGNDLRGVFFADANTGTIVGTNGVILRTTNGGANWVPQSSGTTNWLFSVFFTDANTGTVVGEGPTIIRTTDGGASWASQTSGTGNTLRGVFFTDTNTGTIVGGNGTILRTTNGGAAWVSQSSGTTNWLHAVFFTDANTGTAVGDAGTILRTTDGGASWVPQSSGPTYPLFGISFSDANTGTAVGEGGILRTTNGGASWVAQNGWVGSVLDGVSFTEANMGIVVGAIGTILHTIDGGASWVPQSSGTTNFLSAVALAGTNNWTVVGENGVILRSTASAVTWQSSITVSDACGGSRSLIFGQMPGATDGIDPLFGEEDPPPLPPAGAFDSRFTLPVMPPVASYKDFRCDTLKALIWRMTFQGCGYPMVFTWDSTGLHGGSFYLRDEATGIIVNVDMKKEGRYTLANSGITSLQINYIRDVCRDVVVTTGWNIVSIPVGPPDTTVSASFPGAVSRAYAYNNGYFVPSGVTVGEGFWLKFSGPNTFAICGRPAALRDIAVKAGWNIVGPFEDDAPTAAITSTPTEIVVSQFYGYTNGYTAATTLGSGKGYWVKSSQDGVLHLPNTAPRVLATLTGQDRSWVKIVVECNDGQKGIVYLAKREEIVGNSELPPLPPEGIFDVRYSSNTNVEKLDHGKHEVILNSALFPIKIMVENLSGNVLTVEDAVDGKLVNQSLQDGKVLIIVEKLSKLIVEESGQGPETPTQFELSQNYPNPFNPSTLIKYALPLDTHVRLTVYNTLGQTVTTLIDSDMKAGYYKTEFSASTYASGTYFYRIEAGSFIAVKKLLILK